MIKKKVCMLGAFAVGKTSLVQQYVHSIFSDKYHTTVGVKIEKTRIQHQDRDVDLIIWDLHGEDDFQHIRMSYLKGSSGILYVVDGTRKNTLATALNLHQIAQNSMGPIPFILIINKLDLKDQWEIDAATLADMNQQGIDVVLTSAKTGTKVDEAFQTLTCKMMEG